MLDKLSENICATKAAIFAAVAGGGTLAVEHSNIARNIDEVAGTISSVLGCVASAVAIAYAIWKWHREIHHSKKK
jgi:protein-S-isoprenylcysteine O-methyltransferase Ste14